MSINLGHIRDWLIPGLYGVRSSAGNWGPGNFWEPAGKVTVLNFIKERAKGNMMIKNGVVYKRKK